MEAQELLIIHPSMCGNSDKYIWIDESVEERRNAQCLFDLLLREKIYVKGFASRSPALIGLKLYNKMIVDMSSLKETQLVFSDSHFRPYTSCLESRIQKARIINPQIKGKDIFIWGAGITGEKVFQILSEGGFPVRGFIDSGQEKWGTEKCNLSVNAPAYLEQQEKEYVVVEALENWKDVDTKLKKEGRERFRFCFEPLLDDICCYENGRKRKLFRLSNFWMFHRFAGKRIYIYGNGAAEKAFAEYLKLMDYHFCGFLSDGDSDNTDGTCHYIEEIWYEDNFYIWIYDKGRAEKLEEMGLQCLVQWECNEFPWDITRNRKEGLDVNLGYTSLADSAYPGMTVYGENREENYKIAVLGGSTSDGILYRFPSWPEFLYEDFRQMGVTVYNGAVSGYTSGQELFKLIRDILPLKPDMVIVYDGCNDLNGDTGHPFSFAYSKAVFDFAKDHMEKEASPEYTQKVCEGVDAGLSRFEQYLCNIRNMHAIATEHEMKFFGFCQPVLSCKEGKSAEEKNILLSMPSGRVDFWITDYFRKDLEARTDLPGYLYDLTGAFDKVDDVYMDVCHVNEKGNRIIAGRIKEIIYDTVVRDIERKSLHEKR